MAQAPLACNCKVRVKPGSNPQKYNASVIYVAAGNFADPGFAPRNLCQNFSHHRVFDFIHNQLRASYQYFAVPPLLPGPKPRKFRSSIVSTTFYAPIVNNVK